MMLMLANFFTSLVHFIFITLLPLYALSIGGNNVQAGLLTGLYSFSALIFRPVFGKLLDKKGRKPVVLIGLSLITLMSAAYILCDTVSILLVLRMINGIGFSAGSTAIATVIADIVPPHRLAEGIGYFGLSNTLAQAVGPLLGLFLIQHYGYGVLLCTVLGISVLSMLCALPVKYPQKIELQREHQEIDSHEKTREGFFEIVLFWPALLLLLIATTMGAVSTFVAKYALTQGINDIGSFFTVFALGTMVTRIGFGKLSSRFGLGKILAPAIMAVILSQIVLSVATQLWVFIIAAIFYGLGMGCISPILNTVVVLFASPHRKGEAVAVYYCAMDIGVGLGAIIWGVVAQYFGFSFIYILAGFCSSLALIIYYLFLKKALKSTRH